MLYFIKKIIPICRDVSNFTTLLLLHMFFMNLLAGIEIDNLFLVLLSALITNFIYSFKAL